LVKNSSSLQVRTTCVFIQGKNIRGVRAKAKKGIKRRERGRITGAAGVVEKGRIRNSGLGSPGLSSPLRIPLVSPISPWLEEKGT
jgi:hypothetical protein